MVAIQQVAHVLEDVKMTKDTEVFGEGVWIYCNQHLAPHQTGWCTVSIHNKTLLNAKDQYEAVDECRVRGFTLYDDILHERNKELGVT